MYDDLVVLVENSTDLFIDANAGTLSNVPSVHPLEKALWFQEIYGNCFIGGFDKDENIIGVSSPDISILSCDLVIGSIQKD